MTEAVFVIRNRGESIPAFNERLSEACWSLPASAASLSVVDGTPIVTLQGGVEQATEEDVWDGIADAVGDPIHGPVIDCIVSGISFADPKKAAKAEDRLKTLIDMAQGPIEDVVIVTGEHYDWVTGPNGESVYLPVKKTYAMVTWVDDGDGDGEDDGDDGDDVDDGDTDTDTDTDDDGDDGDDDDAAGAIEVEAEIEPARNNSKRRGAEDE